MVLNFWFFFFFFGIWVHADYIITYILTGIFWYFLFRITRATYEFHGAFPRRQLQAAFLHENIIPDSVNA